MLLDNILGKLGPLTNVAEPYINSGISIFDSMMNNRILKKNYELQKDNLQYQKDLQQEIFNREDNAVARRVADLKNAGLSPTLAAGSSAGAGSVVSTTAPQIGAFNSPKMQAYDFMNLANIYENLKATSLNNEIKTYDFEKSKELGLRSFETNNLAKNLELVRAFVDAFKNSNNDGDFPFNGIKLNTKKGRELFSEWQKDKPGIPGYGLGGGYGFAW